MEIDVKVLPIQYRERGKEKWFVYVYYMKWGTVTYSKDLDSYFVFMEGANTEECKTKQEAHNFVQDHMKEFFEMCLTPDPDPSTAN